MKILFITDIHSSDGDWHGLYFNNELQYEHHSIDGRRALQFLQMYLKDNKIDQITYNDFEIDSEDLEVSSDGTLPCTLDTLKDIIKDHKFQDLLQTLARNNKTYRYKLSLDTGYAGCSHDDILEFDHILSQEEEEEELRAFIGDCIETSIYLLDEDDEDDVE